MDLTEEDLEWMAQRALALTKERLRVCGRGAVLSEPEERAILTQVLLEGARRGAARVEQAERKAREEALRTGSPTLRVSLGDLIKARVKT